MKILVTGAAGFIGFHVTQKLIERGDEVVGLDNINDYYDTHLKYARLHQLGFTSEVLQDNMLVNSSLYHRLSFYKASLEDASTLHTLFEQFKFDAVCNLGAQAGVRYSLENPSAYIQSNLLGFFTILEACRTFKIKNLSYASSSSVYGLNQSQPFRTSDHTDHPISLYAATKKSNELMAHAYSHLYHIPTTGLRFFTVYGPWGRPDMAPTLFANAISNNLPINVFNNGHMYRDFTYIDDIVHGILKVIDNPATPSSTFDPCHPNPALSTAPFRIYNIGNNKPTDLLAFIKILEKALGKSAVLNFLPLQSGDVVSTCADMDDFIHDLHYQPITSLEEGIFKFVEWYKAYYM